MSIGNMTVGNLVVEKKSCADCDWQSKVKIEFLILIVNSVFFVSIQIQKSSYYISLNKIFMKLNELSCERSPFGILGFTNKICCYWIFLKVAELWLDLDWQPHICDGFGLDWQSKIIELSNGLKRGNICHFSTFSVPGWWIWLWKCKMYSIGATL